MSAIREHLATAIRGAAVYNSVVQEAPSCVLWPDGDRQWEAAIAALQNDLPELLVFGDYAPEERRGPAIWLRCAIAGKANGVDMPEECVPIIYLPGVSRQHIRAVESCQEELKPLAELQYRGVFWSQTNAKDWTVLAFLKSDLGGLGLDVAQDSETRNAIRLALNRLIDEDTDLLLAKRLDKDYFNSLLTGADIVREVLVWIDQDEGYRSSRTESAWEAFGELCKSALAFDPREAGVLEAAARLATRHGPWVPVWERYCEAPRRYPNIPNRIRQCRMPPTDLFACADTHGGWPQWNDSAEESLRRDLLAVGQLPEHEARRKLVELEQEHADRRSLVWAELGEAPLVRAVGHLAILAEATGEALAAGTAEDLQARYTAAGWRADRAVLDALAQVREGPSLDAVTAAIRAVYLPWLECSARYLQKVVHESGYLGGTISTARPEAHLNGECILFVDGLRYDTGLRLSEELTRDGVSVKSKPVWAPLPTITATGKPAVTPVKLGIAGAETTGEFDPLVAETGKSVKGGYHLRKLLGDAGWDILDHGQTGEVTGKAWCEVGNIDHEGHERGWKLAHHLSSLLAEVRSRVAALLLAGWKRVRIVTDHGWLLVPGGLPKIELPRVLTENKWGRCAALKPGVNTHDRLYPWYWNPHQHFALADGVSCYKSGEEYSHGGLSLQECLTVELLVSQGRRGGPGRVPTLSEIGWKGLRCNVRLSGQYQGLQVDLRTQAGNPNSSVVKAPSPIKDDGTASVLVLDDALEGNTGTVVVIDAKGSLIAQETTTIGGGEP